MMTVEESAMQTTKMKAIELIMDWNLWPRQAAQRLDTTNVARMKEALRSGFTLPPVIVDKDSLRIVDGFHRTRATLDVFGDDADIEVTLKTYENEQEMFLEAGATNHHHGLPMGPKDRAHFISKARKMKIPWPAIATALNMDPKRVKEFLEKRTAKTQSGETIALSSGAKHMAGKVLDSAQEHYVRTETGGGGPSMHLSIIINALRSKSVTVNSKTIDQMRVLRDLVEEWLVEVS